MDIFIHRFRCCDSSWKLIYIYVLFVHHHDSHIYTNTKTSSVKILKNVQPFEYVLNTYNNIFSKLTLDLNTWRHITSDGRNERHCFYAVLKIRRSRHAVILSIVVHIEWFALPNVNVLRKRMTQNIRLECTDIRYVDRVSLLFIERQHHLFSYIISNCDKRAHELNNVSNAFEYDARINGNSQNKLKRS